MSTSEKITAGYIEFELLNGRAPHSVLELTKKIKISESTFYKSFANFDKLRQAIPLQAIEKTLARLDEDENYEEFSAREKLLSLYFTLFEELLNNRSYYLFKYSNVKDVKYGFSDWSLFMGKINGRIENILNEAKLSEEIKDRPYIGEHYAKGYKLVFTYLFRVWLKDDSDGFSTTDAAIEKSVNLSFDMLGVSPLDSLIDFGKFAMKTKVI
ncbi:MAG: TetR family transcriptional regulator C-terminal domain-containing protein [Crocinitomicaceae bacterium]